MTKNSPQSAIPYSLQGRQGFPDWVETPSGTIQSGVYNRIIAKSGTRTLNHAEAAAELRRAANFIDFLNTGVKSNVISQVVFTPTPQKVPALLAPAPVQPPVVPTELSCAAFHPKMLEYLSGGNPHVLSDTLKFTPAEKAVFKPYCFVTIESINGDLLRAVRLSDGKPHPFRIISRSVNKDGVEPGYAVLLDDGKGLITGILPLPLPQEEVEHLFRSFNRFYSCK